MGAGGRYYLPFGVFGGAGLNYSRGSINTLPSLGDYDDYSSSSSTNVGFLDFRVEAGYALFIRENFAIEPALSFGMKVLGGKVYEGLVLNYTRLSLNLGMSYFF